MKKKLFSASIVVCSLLALSSCDSSGISNGISSTIKNSLPNLWVSLAQLGAFLVTVFVFIKFAYLPIRKKLKARREYVAKNIADSKDALAKADESQKIADNNIQESRVKASEIIASANKEAKASAEKIHAEAIEEADREREKAKEDIERDRKQMEKDNHNTIVTTALDASKEILGRELNEEDNKKIIDDFIQKKTEEQK